MEVNDSIASGQVAISSEAKGKPTSGTQDTLPPTEETEDDQNNRGIMSARTNS